MTGAIVLAAGQSRRFHGDKRRAPLPDGRTLLEASVDLASAAFDRVIVVLRPDEHGLGDHLAARAPGTSVIACHAEHAADGMGCSLAAGAEVALAMTPAWDVTAVMLADMPFIDPVTLATLRDASGENIIVPLHRDQRGHPVLFPNSLLAELTDLAGDEGARRVLKAHADQVIAIAVDDPGVLQDVDTRDALPPG